MNNHLHVCNRYNTQILIIQRGEEEEKKREITTPYFFSSYRYRKQ